MRTLDLESGMANRKRALTVAAAEARWKKSKINRILSERKELVLEQRNKIAKHREMYAKINIESRGHQAQLSDVSKKAIEAVKLYEKTYTETLGYNPYQSVCANIQQGVLVAAKSVSTHHDLPNATTNCTTHTHTTSSSGTRKKEGIIQAKVQPSTISPEFESAVSILVGMNNHDMKLANSVRILHKLIRNAVRDGNTDEKKRMIRISNANNLVQEAVNNMHGALDLMMSVGFILTENEEDSETYLVYPPGDNGPIWLHTALNCLEEYHKQLLNE